MKFKKRNIQVVDHSTGQTLDFPTFGKVAGEEAITELEKNVDNKIADLKSMVGTPLKASTASAMKDSEKIYVYTGSESGYTNGHWYYHDGSKWVDGGVYNSTAVETDKTLSVENVPADAKKTGDEVSALKNTLSDVKDDLNFQELKFEAVADVFVNIFDGNYADNYVVLTNGVFQQLDNCETAIVPCNGGETIFVKPFGTHNRFLIACGTKMFPIGETVSIITPRDPNLTGCYEVVVPSDASFLYIYVSNQGETPDLYVGTKEVLSFVNYGSAVNADNEVGNAVKLTDHVTNILSANYIINLFDGNYILDEGLLLTSGLNGIYTKSDGSRTIVVPIKPSTRYYFRSFDAHNRFRYCTTEAFPKIGDAVSVLDNVASVTGYYDMKFTSGSNANWLIFTISNQSETPRVQITEGVDDVTFIGYDYMKSKEDTSNTKWFFLDDIEGTFDTDTVINDLDASTTKITDIYSIYDALVANHPNYVSKTVLGTVSTENLEMRKYVFNSMEIQNDSTYYVKKPKLLLIAGIHGYEQGSSYCLARVMRQITEGTDSIAKFIRNNIEIVVVPVANPYGYNHNQRKNENGVDLNRNFNAGWSAGDEPSSEYYGGATPDSEAETQILTTLLNNNKDAYYAIDFHNIANGYPLMYLYSDQQAQLCNSLFTVLSNKWRSEYSGFPTNRLLGYCNTGVNACFAKQALSDGINSFVAEIPWIMPVIGSVQYDVPTLTVGCDVVGNVLTIIAKSLV